MFPFLKNINILRQWTGICDMTPDYAPIMGTGIGYRRVLAELWVGYVWLQGGAYIGEDDGGTNRHG